jgi:hypothetical protein
MKSITFFLLFTISLLGQTSQKKEYLFDETGNIIKQQEFKKKIDTSQYTYLITENDTAYIARLHLREEFGSITENERQEVISEIKSLTKKEINDNQIIIINYFYKEITMNQRPCIDHYTEDSAYKRFCKRKGQQLVQLFITEKGFNYNKDFVFQDKNEIIRNLLFKTGSLCGNYIIIKPNGRFYRHIGEYRQNEIPDKIKANW